MKLYTPFNAIDMSSVERGDIECKDESLAEQDTKDEADINVLVERFGITGQIPQKVVMPFYQDLSNPLDFRTAMDYVVEAQNAFMQLPADIRSRVNNDPQKWLEFVTDAENIPELTKLGIAVRVVDTPEKVQKVEIVNERAKST